MTDVLELLLREPEEDENQWEDLWNTGQLPREMAAITNAAQTGSGLQTERIQRAIGTDSPNGRNLSAQIGAVRSRPLNGEQTLQEAAWSISDRMTRLHQAAQRRERPSAQPGSPIGAFSGQDTLSVRGGAEQKWHTADYAAQVDAVFARDARRYDGPLRLL